MFRAGIKVTAMHDPAVTLPPEADYEDTACDIDHILPYKFGGTTTEENLQVTCRKCNAEKGIS